MSGASTAHVADLIVLGFLVLAALIGFISGFTRLILGLIAWLGALKLADLSVPYIAPFLAGIIPYTLMANIAAGSITFIICLSIFVYLSRAISSGVKAIGLGVIDRPLGMIFGISLGALLFSAVFNFAPKMMSDEKYKDLMTNSKFAPYLEKGAEFSRDLIFMFFKKALPDAASATTTAESTSSEDLSQKLVKKLSSPQPKATSKAPEKGYEGTERQELEKILETEMQPTHAPTSVESAPPSAPVTQPQTGLTHE